MNIADYVKKHSRLELERLANIGTSATIILPINMYDATKEMCDATNETRGVMLCAREKDQLWVKHMLTLGYGSPTSVFPEDRKVDAVNQLLRERTDLRAIDYHTHTRGTGELFYERFSSQDLKSLAININRSNNYMHVLFTPTHILTFGLNSPSIALGRSDWLADFEQEIISSRYNGLLNS